MPPRGRRGERGHLFSQGGKKESRGISPRRKTVDHSSTGRKRGWKGRCCEGKEVELTFGKRSFQVPAEKKGLACPPRKEKEIAVQTKEPRSANAGKKKKSLWGEEKGEIIFLYRYLLAQGGRNMQRKKRGTDLQLSCTPSRGKEVLKENWERGTDKGCPGYPIEEKGEKNLSQQHHLL